jgi:hypothetical protein
MGLVAVVEAQFALLTRFLEDHCCESTLRATESVIMDIL